MFNLPSEILTNIFERLSESELANLASTSIKARKIVSYILSIPYLTKFIHGEELIERYTVHASHPKAIQLSEFQTHIPMSISLQGLCVEKENNTTFSINDVKYGIKLYTISLPEITASVVTHVLYFEASKLLYAIQMEKFSCGTLNITA